jgi:16S rRNA (guanine966-N2)-methyltransferase
LDRVREALFSILGPLDDEVVVDFYAGSGALGFEALSRGARRAILVESDREAARMIRDNAKALALGDECQVIESRVERSRAVLQSGPRIDLVLADPPWRISAEALGVVEQTVSGLLAPDARLVVGHMARDALEPGPDSRLRLSSCRRWGDSALSFFEQSEYVEPSE